MQSFIHGGAAIAGLLALGAGAAMCLAEIPPLRPEQLKDTASLILVGKIARIYVMTEKSGKDFERDNFVAEVQVEKIEKGKHEGKLAYVRYWRRRFVGQGFQPPGSYGHRDVPKIGATATIYATQAEDGGLDVMLPNGFGEAKETAEKKVD